MTETDVVRQYAEAQLKRLAAERERAQMRLDSIIERQTAYELVLRDLDMAAANATSPRRVVHRPRVSADELRSLEREDAAVLIAERSNGVLESTPAREIMVEAGLLPQSSINAASTALYATLSTSDRFESAGRGKWRLIQEAEKEKPAEPASPFYPSLVVNGR